MLVLSRTPDKPEIIITVPGKEPGTTQRLSILLMDVRGDKIRLGFTGDAESVRVNRREIQDLIDQEATLSPDA